VKYFLGYATIVALRMHIHALCCGGVEIRHILIWGTNLIPFLSLFSSSCLPSPNSVTLPSNQVDFTSDGSSITIILCCAHPVLHAYDIAMRKDIPSTGLEAVQGAVKIIVKYYTFYLTKCVFCYDKL
jgi:hypothetical protein